MCACRDAIKRAQAQLETFQQGAPPYPKTLFKGKGIVLMAGGLTYFVPAWINIHMLRKTGMPQVYHCMLCLMCQTKSSAGPWIASIHANTCANQTTAPVAVAYAVQHKGPYHGHLSVHEVHCNASVRSCFASNPAQA